MNDSSREHGLFACNRAVNMIKYGEVGLIIPSRFCSEGRLESITGMREARWRDSRILPRHWKLPFRSHLEPSAQSFEVSNRASPRQHFNRRHFIQRFAKTSIEYQSHAFSATRHLYSHPLHQYPCSFKFNHVSPETPSSKYAIFIS
jgi:hypothetical protein